MNRDSRDKRQSATGHDPGIFFIQKTGPAETQQQPHETVQSLKEELRRANEHIYELYQRLADKEKQ
tara:strand:+ start:1310 stop:1507 length:198 start_codon:yes stop_codon:yes gene_type:complete